MNGQEKIIDKTYSAILIKTNKIFPPNKLPITHKSKDNIKQNSAGLPIVPVYDVCNNVHTIFIHFHQHAKYILNIINYIGFNYMQHSLPKISKQTSNITELICRCLLILNDQQHWAYTTPL